MIYTVVILIRNLCYDLGVFKIYKIEGCQIISVGNISVGGSGKTPIVVFLANYLRQNGKRVAILSRGYGRKSKGMVIVSDQEKILTNIDSSGDEPLLLAKQLKKIPVVVESDRVKGARLIVEKFNPDVIILDDAYQHRRIYRDLNIAVIDSSRGFGNGLLLPSGFLREPISSLKRADLAWFTRIDQAKNIDNLQSKINKIKSLPQIKSKHIPFKLVQLNTAKQFKITYLKQKNVMLVSGIGNQDSFELTIEQLGAKVVHHEKFADHHKYTNKDIQNIRQRQRAVKADIIVTTEKDYYRLEDLTKKFEHIFYLLIKIKIEPDNKFLEKALYDFI